MTNRPSYACNQTLYFCSTYCALYTNFEFNAWNSWMTFLTKYGICKTQLSMQLFKIFIIIVDANSLVGSTPTWGVASGISARSCPTLSLIMPIIIIITKFLYYFVHCFTYYYCIVCKKQSRMLSVTENTHMWPLLLPRFFSMHLMDTTIPQAQISTYYIVFEIVANIVGRVAMATWCIVRPDPSTHNSTQFRAGEVCTINMTGNRKSKSTEIHDLDKK